jgi:hypothetical protein
MRIRAGYQNINIQRDRKGKMAYHINDDAISLEDLRKRIEETDLVPSRIQLLEGIKIKFQTLEQQGIPSLARLRHELKSPKRIEALARATGIDTEYLILLRREIESYFPKPFALKDFDWLPKEVIDKLSDKNIRNTADLYEAARSGMDIDGVDEGTLEELFRLADLTRVQWISPKAARMLLDAGYDNTRKLAEADAEVLCDALLRVNEGDRYFKGRIGLRDVKRLIFSARYVLS